LRNADDFRVARGRGLESAFAAGAVVRFAGCNIAYGKLGLEFLEEFGKTFLLKGGTVSGSEAMVDQIGGHELASERAVPFLGPTRVPWAWSKLVKVKPGGVNRELG
jgi:hypothetical protein